MGQLYFNLTGGELFDLHVFWLILILQTSCLVTGASNLNFVFRSIPHVCLSVMYYISYLCITTGFSNKSPQKPEEFLR